MAQYKWKQIDGNLPAEGKQLSGSLQLTGSLGVTGSLSYNGELLEDYIASQIVTGSNNWDTIANIPSNLFSGSFVAGDNITISQNGQVVTIATTADVIPEGTVSGSSQINFLEISNVPSGLISSSAQILPILTSSITNFDTEVSRSVASFGFGTGDVSEAEIQDSIVTASLAGSYLILTKRDLTSFGINLGDVVPDTPTGSFVTSGSFDVAPTILTLYRPEGNIQVDLSGIGGSINDGDVTAVFAGGGLAGGGEGGDLVLSVNAAPAYGTNVQNDFISIATSSLYFVHGVESAILTSSLVRPIFTQTGSYYATPENLKVTGSFDVSGDVNFASDLTVAGRVTAQEFHSQFVSASIIYQSGSTKFGDTEDDIHDFTGSVNISGSVDTADVTIDDWGSVSASLASNYLYTSNTSASLAADLTSTSGALSTEINTLSSSLELRVTAQEEFSSSLDDTFATDAELNTVSASLKTFATDADSALSASLAVDITTNANNLEAASSSLALRVTAQEDFSSSLDDTFATDVELNTVSASLKTFATDADTALSASLATDITANNTALQVASSSLSLRVTAQEEFSSSLNDTFATDQELSDVSSSLATSITSTNADLGNVSSSLATSITDTNTDLNTASSSLALRVTAQEEFSSSLDATFATDLELNTVSASLKVFATDADTALSASLAVDIESNSTNLTTASSSLALRVTAQEEFSSSLDDTFATDVELNTVSASLKTFTTDADTVLSASFESSLNTASSSLALRVTAQEEFSSSLDSTFATDAELASLSSSIVANYLKNTTDTLDGDLVVTGILTAREFHTTFVSASIIYASGSTKFGDTADDIHQFTGSLRVTGSITAIDLSVLNSVTASNVYINDWGSLSASLASINADIFSLEATFNSYTSSTDLRLSSIEAATSSYLQAADVAELNLFTGSANSRLFSLEAATGSYLVTGSVDENTITLQRADGSSFTLEVNAAIFKATGSVYAANSDIAITGSLDVNFTESNQEFRVSSQSITQFTVNNNGVMVLTAREEPPTAVSGGIYYSTNGSFYFGTV